MVGGPTGAAYNGTFYKWYNVNWDDGLSGWSVQDGMAKSTGTSAVLNVSTTSLTLFATTQGTAGAATSFTVSGSGLGTGDTVNVLAPTGCEISRDGWSFYTTFLLYPDNNGTLGNTTVYARIRADATQNVNGYLTLTDALHSSVNKSISVSGAVNPGTGVLSVTPSSGLSSSGNAGGSFSPSSQSDTVQNTGTASLNWSASKTQSWVSLSATSGTLAAGGSTTVTVSINSNANSLSAGNYSDTVSFTNTTNGYGNASRSVSLTVTAPAVGVLSVTPSSGLSSSGNAGGSFSPSSQSAHRPEYRHGQPELVGQ